MDNYPFFGARLPHRYSFACEGLNHVRSREFPTREAANDLMYALCSKHGLNIVKVWDDHHDKTYCCDNGVKFFISRM